LGGGGAPGGGAGGAVAHQWTAVLAVRCYLALDKPR